MRSYVSSAVAVRHILPLVASALLACGGGGGDGGTGPNPPPTVVPVVTTVEVTPLTSSVVAGETAQLSATVKDQNGAVMSGRTVSWSSSSINIASVSGTGLVTAVAQGQATITATVEGKQGSAQVTVTPAPRITLDASATKTAQVDNKGATLTATASDGLVYVLEIPANAVDVATTISMTPVKQFRELPYSGGVVGAVELAPAGLRFKLPAVLHIKTSPNVPDTQRLVAMYYDGDGSRVLPGPAVASSSEVRLLISEIGISAPAAQARGMLMLGAAVGGNGAGAALATPQDLTLTPIPPTSSAQQIGWGQLAGLKVPGDLTAIVAAMRTWFQGLVPIIQAANSDVTLRNAMYEYFMWDAQFDLFATFNPLTTPLVAPLTPELQSGMSLLLASFRPIAASLNQTCVTTRSLLAANNILFLYTRLQVLDRLQLLEAQGTGYPEADVFRDLCIKVVVTDSTLVNPLVPGTPAQLDLRFGIKFENDPNVTANVPFELTLVTAGTTQDVAHTVNTDVLGKYNTSLTALGTTDVHVAAAACIAAIAGEELKHVCERFQIDRLFGRVLTGSLTIASDAGLAQIADVSKIVGSIIIQGANVTSTDLRELSRLTEVTGGFLILNVPTLTTLTGLKNLAKVGQLMLSLNTAMVSPSLPPRLTDIPFLSVSGGGLKNLDGFFGVPRIGFLVLNGVQLTTLDPLRRTVIDQGFNIQSVAGLTSLSGLNLGTKLMQAALQDQPLLTDLSAMAGVTEVDDLFLGRLGAAVHSFPKLAKVLRMQILPGPEVQSYGFPLLTVVNSLSISLSSACQGRAAPFSLALPALQTIIGLTYQGTGTSAPTCFSGLPPGLKNLSLERVSIVGGALSDVTLKFVQNGPAVNSNLGLQVAGALDLTHLAITGPTDINGNLTISGNPKLSSFTFGGSVNVRGAGGLGNATFNVCNNAVLTGASFGGSVQVNGTALIASNPNLDVNLARTWPITATKGVTITSAFKNC